MNTNPKESQESSGTPSGFTAFERLVRKLARVPKTEVNAEQKKADRRKARQRRKASKTK